MMTCDKMVNTHYTEHIGVVVTFQTRIRGVSCSNPNWVVGNIHLDFVVS
jgi:hypothetical protein